MTKILSIDWDYFFPDSTLYDWGHNETVFFLELIWQLRLTDRNLITGKEAFTEYFPTIPNNFWSIITNKPTLYIAESHATITQLPIENSIINHLDAHHDSGYYSLTNIDCGNWAAKSNIKEFHVYYPSWRQPKDESTPIKQPTTIQHGLPKPTNYDLVFICRSGCWTPPWFDLKFEKFITDSKLSIFKMDQYIKKLREPNYKNALIAKPTQELQFNQLRILNSHNQNLEQN